MKFTRRPDLDPQTRIHIVMLAWLHQGVYGKMTQIANYYLPIRRTKSPKAEFLGGLSEESTAL